MDCPFVRPVDGNHVNRLRCLARVQLELVLWVFAACFDDENLVPLEYDFNSFT